MDIKKSVAEISIGDLILDYGSDSHWKSVCKMITAQDTFLILLPCDVPKLGPREVARLIAGTLVADTNWLPFHWPNASGGSDTQKYPSETENITDSPYPWWHGFLADLVIVLQQALQARADEMQACFLREAHEVYERLTRELLTLPISDEQKQLLAGHQAVSRKHINADKTATNQEIRSNVSKINDAKDWLVKDADIIDM